MGACVAVAMTLTFVAQARSIGSVSGDPYVVDFPTSGPLNVMLAQGDGQAFAALATDPSLARPEMFAGQTADSAVGVEAAYRAQRPLLGYLAWLGSFGQPGLVNYALLALSILGSAAMAATVAHYLYIRGAKVPALGMVTLVLPGAVLAASWMGPEALGVALAIGGLIVVPTRIRVAVLLFIAAAFVRETMLIVPGALGAWFLLSQKDVRRTAAMTVPFVAFASWLVVVHARYGAWPWQANQGRTSLPFLGFVDAIGKVSGATLVLGALNLLLVPILIRYRRDPLAWIIAAFIAAGSLLGWEVWDRANINRILLPAQVLAIVVLATGVHEQLSGGSERAVASKPSDPTKPPVQSAQPVTR